MPISFVDKEVTPATILAEIKAAILASTDWTQHAVTAVNTTSTVATTAAGTTMTISSAAGFVVGQSIVVAAGTANERVRGITAIAGNVITINTTWGVILPIGTTVATRHEVLKSTTTSGAELIIDLAGDLFDTNYLGVAFYKTFAGTAPGGWTDRAVGFVMWKTTAMTTAQPVHLIVSAGKDHLFIQAEGPRAHEAGTTSTTYGSIKNYILMSDVVAYHAADLTPCIVAMPVTSAVSYPNAGSVVANSHQCGISKNSADNNFWGAGRLATLTFPTVFSSDVVPVNRQCTIDGETYLLPYVLFSEGEGIRGRLRNIYYANTNTPSPTTDYPDPVGTRVEYNGIVYKMIAANKGDGSLNAWGPLGSVAQSTAPMRSIIVAVPYTEAVP